MSDDIKSELQTEIKHAETKLYSKIDVTNDKIEAMNQRVNDHVSSIKDSVYGINQNIALISQKMDSFVRPCTDFKHHLTNHPDPKDIELHLKQDVEDKRIKKNAWATGIAKLVGSLAYLFIVAFLTYLATQRGLK